MNLRLPRPGPASLRLTLAVAGGIILLSIQAMMVQYRVTARSLEERQLALLQSDMDAFAAFYEQRRIPALREAIEFRAEASEASSALFLLLDKQGRRLAGNVERWPGSLPMPQEDPAGGPGSAEGAGAAGTSFDGTSVDRTGSDEAGADGAGADGAGADGAGAGEAGAAGTGATGLTATAGQSPAPGAGPERPTGPGFDLYGLRSFNVILGQELVAFRGVARMLPGGFALLVARGTGGDAQTLSVLRRNILVVGAVLAVVALVAGWAVSRRVIGRIQRLNDLADRVAAGDLAARLPGSRSKDEFGALETHVHRMLDRIQNLNRAQHRLSDSIAHELRTPLSRMMQKLQAFEGQDAALQAVRAEMRQAIRIFDSLLDISSAEAQSGTSAGFVPVGISAVAAEVWELYEPVGEDRGLAMAADLAPDLWILGDRNLIAQLLSNLIDNAIKFTPEGGRVHLSLTAGEGGRHLLQVTDSGPGLPPEMRSAVFDRFVRAKETDAVKGHGLGLALVQAIATRHGARIELDDADPGLVVRSVWPMLAPPEEAG